MVRPLAPWYFSLSLLYCFLYSLFSARLLVLSLCLISFLLFPVNRVFFFHKVKYSSPYKKNVTVIIITKLLFRKIQHFRYMERCLTFIVHLRGLYRQIFFLLLYIFMQLCIEQLLYRIEL